MRADQGIKNALVAGFIGQAQRESCTKHPLPFVFQSILSIVITVSFVPVRFPERTQKGTLKHCNAGSLTGNNCAHEEAQKKRVDTCQDAAWGSAALFLVALTQSFAATIPGSKVRAEAAGHAAAGGGGGGGGDKDDDNEWWLIMMVLGFFPLQNVVSLKKW